jgi:poly(3-hydroxybutyrate) depolymerase
MQTVDVQQGQNFRRWWAPLRSVPVLAAILASMAVLGCESSAEPAAATDTSASTQDAVAGSDSAVGSDVAVVAGPPEPVAYDACPEIKIGTNKATFGGFARTFRVYAPKGETTAAPGLMFIWHGLGDTSGNMANYIGAQTLATKIGAYAVGAGLLLQRLYQPSLLQPIDWLGLY